MSKFDRVLSDDEVDDIVKNTTMLLGRSIARSKDFILKVEQAVLAKLAEQEPAGYVAKAPFDADYFKYGDGINFYKKESHLLSEFSKATPIPLYAHPMPCVSPTSDKTACVSEIAENDKQIKEHHRTTKNPIADARKKAPEGWQLVPVEPDQALLASMATCLNHGFGLLTKEKQDGQLYDMRKIYDEVVGKGYYSTETRDRYLSMLTAAPKHTGEK